MARWVRYILMGICLGAIVAMLSQHWKSEKGSSSSESDSIETYTGLGNIVEERIFPKEGDAAGPYMDPETAIVFLFANYDYEENMSSWRPVEGSRTYRYINDAFDYVKMLSAVVFSSSYSEAGRPHFIVIIQTAPNFDSCHACQVVLSGAIFEQTDGQWRLKRFNPTITRAGSYGRAPKDMSLVKIGPDLHGVRVIESYMGQGCTTEWCLLIGPVGDRLEELVSIFDIGESYMGDCDRYLTDPTALRCWEYSSAISFVQGANSTYFDIKVTTSGTDMQLDNTVASFERTTVYGFNGCCYVEGPAVDYSSDKPYYIQVAAFENYQSAKEMAARLREAEFLSSCEFYKPDNDNSLFRVQVPNYSTRKEAEHDLQELRQLGYDGIIQKRYSPQRIFQYGKSKN